MGITATDAAYFGIQSVPAAAVFAALYLLFLAGFILQSFRERSRVYYSLTFFCAVRLTSFILRAIIAGTRGNNVGLLIGAEVLFAIGFFSLIYSTYNLVLDRELLSEHTSSSIISRVIRRRHLFRLVLLAAIVMGSVGISDINTSNDSNTISTGKSLHTTSTIIFFVLSVLVVYQALIVAKNELRYGAYKLGKGAFGRFQPYILLLISLLLLVREGFAMVTVNDFQKANNERLWYPLIAMPEILAVALFSIPGLVPGKREFPAKPETPRPAVRISRSMEVFHEGKN
ncbi:hypothetical protein J132_03204 [Termitomyces sp. J132]|nr:hypothetical protein H2248_010209 [Termitomyces sp. 'cryptogamus']KNZ77927.1 hypothetical protein J132_03204 [Termitomyces sp. J132]